MSIKCAECQCTPQDCTNERERCSICTKEVCCCLDIHSVNPKPKMQMLVDDDCCANGSCKSEAPLLRTEKPSLNQFFKNVKGLYAAALGIEILCIAAAEIGENSGLYVFGFNHIGISIAYAMGYALATFTTFVTILGRYNYGSTKKIVSCCSVLEQDEAKGFFPSLLTTFRNFSMGLVKLQDLPKQSNLKQIIKTSLLVLITAETACIITAETVDLRIGKMGFASQLQVRDNRGQTSSILQEYLSLNADQLQRLIKNHDRRRAKPGRIRADLNAVL